MNYERLGLILEELYGCLHCLNDWIDVDERFDEGSLVARLAEDAELLSAMALDLLHGREPSGRVLEDLLSSRSSHK